MYPFISVCCSMDAGPLSKRPKVVEGGSNESDLLLQDQKFVNERSYVIQLFHALGYDDVSKTVIETICNLIKEWLLVITVPVKVKTKQCLPYVVWIIFAPLGVVFASAISFLLGNILSLLQRPKALLKIRNKRK